MDMEDITATYPEGYEDAIDDALEIIKKNPMYPIIVSQKLFLKIKELKEPSQDRGLKNGD